MRGTGITMARRRRPRAAAAAACGGNSREQRCGDSEGLSSEAEQLLAAVAIITSCAWPECGGVYPSFVRTAVLLLCLGSGSRHPINSGFSSRRARKPATFPVAA